MSKLQLLDITLRAGNIAAEDVDFSLNDRLALAQQMDALGLDMIDIGTLGGGAVDDAIFADLPKLGHSALAASMVLTNVPEQVFSTEDHHALVMLPSAAVIIRLDHWFDLSLGLNSAQIDARLAYLEQLVQLAAENNRTVFVELAHFFTALRLDPAYARRVMTRLIAIDRVSLIAVDSNGGCLPDEVGAAFLELKPYIALDRMGFLGRDDSGTAVANSLAAAAAGVGVLAGAFGRMGEGAGWCNLASLLPALVLKRGYSLGVTRAKLGQLTPLVRLLDERLNRLSDRKAPYTGELVFQRSLDDMRGLANHIDPAQIGNRALLGMNAHLLADIVRDRLQSIGLDIAAEDDRLLSLVELVRHREFQGYAYDAAEASFELLARRAIGQAVDFFRVLSFRVIDERRWNSRGELFSVSEATVKLELDGQEVMNVAEGNGPVNALDAALRKALMPSFPELEAIRLTDFKIRIINPGDGTRAVTRVLVEAINPEGKRWSTVGVSTNVIDASFNAINDSITYCLLGHLRHQPPTDAR